MNYLRGFGYQGGAIRGGWANSGEGAFTGENLLKKASQSPAPDKELYDPVSPVT